MDLDDALAVLATLVGSARHPEGDPALFVVRRELDSARARVAELEAENERLRAVADVARTVEGVVSSWSSNGRETVRELTKALAALDAVPAAEAATHEDT